MPMTDYSQWADQKRDACIISQAGNARGLEAVISAVQKKAPLSAIGLALKGLPNHFGLIIEHEDFVFAATDRTRSFPILYSPINGAVFHPSKDAPLAADEDADPQAVLEFCSAGYILGGRTLYEGIKSLQAGECLLFQKATTSIDVHRYYRYLPAPDAHIDHAEAMSAVGGAIDISIQRSIEYANGRKIWVPLSGGLDSRIVGAKLCEFGYDNLAFFSYGTQGNEEALIAQEVAKRLGREWTMLPAHPKSAKALYESDLCVAYERQTHDYSTICSYVEFEAFRDLKEMTDAKSGDVIINGQSGDYICGAHIPSALYENDNPTDRDMMDFIIDKHFSLWSNLKTPENIALLERSVEAHLEGLTPSLSPKDDLISRYESFEWAERQCKMVVNSHQIYDFFGFDWAMPLWDRALMDVYETMPLDLKYERRVFRDYVADYNYRGVFDLPKAVIKTWQSPLRQFIIAAGKTIEIVQGQDAKQDFYKKMSYYGNAHNQLALFGKASYDEHYRNMRNMISLSVLDYCKRHAIPFPD